MDAIKEEILMSIPDEWFTSDNGNIIKVRKLTPKIKAGVSITDIMDKCPEAIDSKPNTKWLSTNAKGHEFVEFEESFYVMVSKWKASE